MIIFVYLDTEKSIEVSISMERTELMSARMPILCESEIPEFLFNAYGINVTKVEKIDKGFMSNAYKASTGSTSYFFKEPFHMPSDVLGEGEAELLDFLKSRSLPVANLIKTTDGTHYAENGGRLLSLQEFVEGEVYKSKTVPDTLLLPSFEVLGKIDGSLVDYKLPVRQKWTARYCEDYSEEEIVQELKDFLIEAETLNLCDEELRRVRRGLKFAIRIQPLMKEWATAFHWVTHSSTHGDYHVGNLIYDDRDVVAVIDWTNSSTIPVIYNIMYLYIMFGKERRKIKSIDTSELFACMQEYAKHAPLSYYDYKFAPYVFAHILGRETIPVRAHRYFFHTRNGNSVVAQKRLRSMLRSNKMCRFLIEDADTISKQLEEHYEASLTGYELWKHKKEKRKVKRLLANSPFCNWT